MDNTIILNSTTASHVLVSTATSSTPFTPSEVIIFYSGGILLSVFTVLANLMVILAYRLNAQLQTITHLFIFSLAISDVLIGLFAINFYVVYVALNRWPLGEELCQIWLCVDYVVCQASVIHLLVICMDRYLSIKFPLRYRSHRTRSRGYIALLAIWVIATLQWLPIIVGYPYMVGRHTVPEGECYVQFLTDSIAATLVTAMLAYYVPVFVLAVLYVRVFLMIKRRHQNIRIVQSDPGLVNFEAPSRKRRAVSLGDIGSHHQRETSTPGQPAVVVNRFRRKNGIQHQYAVQEIARVRYLHSQRKAARVMTLVFLNFTISWLPYHILVTVLPVCGECVPKLALQLSYIFCYFNSLINPFCYALGHSGFRKSILKTIGKLKMCLFLTKIRRRTKADKIR